MALSPEQNMVMDKVSEAVDYCIKEADVTVYDVVGALEIIKLNLIHKVEHKCQHCGNQTTCSHCNHQCP